MLLPGEAPIHNAPAITLDNGRACIPQHYLQFRHTLESIEKIIVELDYSARYPIFVCRDQGGLYIQIGIVGFDNYARAAERSSRAKIVYGRKWRVEPELPTSEVIQTVFLALKKAREHEIRELFRVTRQGAYSTPFNNHHDFPLMSQNADLLEHDERKPKGDIGFEELALVLQNIRYDLASFQLTQLQKHTEGRHLVDLFVKPNKGTELPELQPQSLTLILETLDTNELYYELMDAMIKLSDRHVEENFSYQDYCRFSRRYSVEALGELSKQVRRRESLALNAGFEENFTHANYQTDLTRVPYLGEGLNAKKIRSQLAGFESLEGILPSRVSPGPGD